MEVCSLQSYVLGSIVLKARQTQSSCSTSQLNREFYKFTFSLNVSFTKITIQQQAKGFWRFCQIENDLTFSNFSLKKFLVFERSKFTWFTHLHLLQKFWIKCSRRVSIWTIHSMNFIDCEHMCIRHCTTMTVAVTVAVTVVQTHPDDVK